MNSFSSRFSLNAKSYLERLSNSFTNEIFKSIEELACDLRQAWIDGRNVYICGNGGSAANAMHMANDFHYGIGSCGTGPKLPGLRVEALSANSSIITCLANDIDYGEIYSHQLKVKANRKDLLIVLSGSGNSENVVKAIKTAKDIDMRSYAIVAFKGGLCRDLADVPIHFVIDDMQIAEDTQLVVGHLCMQWLNTNKPSNIPGLN